MLNQHFNSLWVREESFNTCLLQGGKSNLVCFLQVSRIVEFSSQEMNLFQLFSTQGNKGRLKK